MNQQYDLVSCCIYFVYFSFERLKSDNYEISGFFPSDKIRVTPYEMLRFSYKSMECAITVLNMQCQVIVKNSILIKCRARLVDNK